MCWVFNCASTGAIPQTQVKPTITILEKTRFFTWTSPFFVVRRNAADRSRSRADAVCHRLEAMESRVSTRVEGRTAPTGYQLGGH